MKYILFSLVMLCLATSTFAQEENETRKVTIIHAGTLLAVAGEAPVFERSVIVEDEKISDIVSGYITEFNDGNAEATIIDLREKFVMAGMMVRLQ